MQKLCLHLNFNLRITFSEIVSNITHYRLTDSAVFAQCLKLYDVDIRGIRDLTFTRMRHLKEKIARAHRKKFLPPR